MTVRNLTDEALLSRTKIARKAAHDAPLNPYRLDADGHRWVQHDSSAWADRSREWCELANEVDRRGLPQPVMDWDGDSRRGSKASRRGEGSLPIGRD
jgi:hypothetical protein